MNGSSKRREDPLRRLDDLIGSGNALEQDAELVAAEPGDRVGRTQAAAQASRDADEHLVAHARGPCRR